MNIERTWGSTFGLYQPSIAVISANMGNFDRVRPHVPQNMEVDFYHFNDENFPLRFNAMTPRLQARIVKTFMWQLVPDYEYYLWIDCSCVLGREDSVRWFMDQIGKNDIAVFRHPNRTTVQQEADYLKERLAMGCKYITPRYEHELLDEQMKEVSSTDPLYASTAFIMKNTPEVRAAMKEWWYHISRYHSIDQLSLPHVIKRLKVAVIEEKYMQTPYLTFVRNK
ncbi:MAG: glycosyltransferase domain-containing protein [Candidatus Paceibacterota bacterium]